MTEQRTDATTSTTSSSTTKINTVDREFIQFLKAVTVTILNHVRCNDLALEFCIAKLDGFALSEYETVKKSWVTVIQDLTGSLPNLPCRTLEEIFGLSQSLHLEARHTPAIKSYPDFLRTFINTEDFETQQALREGFFKKAITANHIEHPIVSTLLDVNKNHASQSSEQASQEPIMTYEELSKLHAECKLKLIELEKHNTLLFNQNQKLELELKEKMILLQLAEGEISKLRYQVLLGDKPKLAQNPIRLRTLKEETSGHDVYQEVLRVNTEKNESIDEHIFRREQDNARLVNLANESPVDFEETKVEKAKEAASVDLMKSWGEALALDIKQIPYRSIFETMESLKNERRVNNSPYFGYLSHVCAQHKSTPFSFNIPWEDIRSEIISELIKVITDSNFKIKGNINDSITFDTTTRELQIKYGVGKHEQKDRVIRLFEVNNGVGIDFNNKLVKNENIKVFMLCARACNQVLNADLLSQDPYGQKGNTIIISGSATGKAEIGSVCKLVLAAQASNLKPVLIPDYYSEQELSDIKETLAQNEFLIKYRAMFGYPDLSFLKVSKTFRHSRLC